MSGERDSSDDNLSESSIDQLRGLGLDVTKQDVQQAKKVSKAPSSGRITSRAAAMCEQVSLHLWAALKSTLR